MPAVNRKAILEAVRQLSPEEQRELAREILQTAPQLRPLLLDVSLRLLLIRVRLPRWICVES